MGPSTEHLLKIALAKREGFTSKLENTDAWRLLHSEGDRIPGVTVDKIGEALLVEEHRRESVADEVVEALARMFPGTPIFLKRRWSNSSDDRCGSQVAGKEEGSLFDIRENGLLFQVDLMNEEHIGFFLDSRPAREFVRGQAMGARVLNLFSYTAGFGVAAAAGGARSTVNIDNKNSASRVGEQNYLRNGLKTDPRTFFKCDALYYLKRAAKQNGRFDLVIVDPPPRFKRRKNTDFLAHRHYGQLLADCARVTAPGGRLFAGLNSLKSDWSGFDKLVEEAQKLAGSRMDKVTAIGPGPDFPECDDRPVARFQLLEIT